MAPALMRVHVRSSIDGVVFFSFLCVWAMHNAEFSDDCQNRLNNGTAVRAERLVLHLVSVSLSFYAIKTTALALAGSRLGGGAYQQAFAKLSKFALLAATVFQP